MADIYSKIKQIKTELLLHVIETSKDVCTDIINNEKILDKQLFYNNVEGRIQEIILIKDLDSLYLFCEAMGYNDIDYTYPFAFNNLMKKYIWDE